MSSKSKENAILQQLRSNERRAVTFAGESVHLAKHATVMESGIQNEFVYFPFDAVIGFTESAAQGGNLEVWAVGHDGVAGISTLLGERNPFRGVVLIPGMAFRAKASAVRRCFQQNRQFHDVLLSYYHALLVQISYLGICNNTHPLAQRLSRWLLNMQDRAGTNKLRVTQDTIASMLGTRRASVSEAAAKLQTRGFISYTPGAITITSRRGLRETACGCYKAVGPRG
jgi:CRP-like cAMP-binding protein